MKKKKNEHPHQRSFFQQTRKCFGINIAAKQDTYSNKWNVIRVLQLFYAEGFHLSLEVRGPWLTGKDKLKKKKYSY